MPDSSVATVFMLSLAVPYALVLAAPGPNLLVVLSAGLAPTARGPAEAALGVACGATLATIAAAYGASIIGASGSFETVGALVFALILARSALKLLSIPPRVVAGAPPRRTGLSGGAFAAGLVVALSNPMTLPFFLSFFVSQPLARTEAGVAISCVTVFTMASLWFVAVGLLLARFRSRLHATDGLWFRRALAVAMLGVAIAAVAREILR